MAHVFISYKHEDGDFAELLKGRLEKEGFETWMDSDIQGGEKWSSAIDQAIGTASTVVVIMSPEARKSDYITYEWSFALGLRKPVVPILLRPVDLHPKLAEIQYIDFSNRNARPWNSIYERLKKIVADAPKIHLENNVQHPQNLDNIPEHVKRAIDVLHDPKYFDSGVPSEEPNPLHRAVDNLASSQHSLAQSELLQALEHPNPDVRRVTAWVLGKKRSDEAVERLIMRVRDHDIEVQLASIRALLQIGNPECEIGLVDALKDDQWEVQALAAQGLANFKTNSTVSALIQTLKARTGTVRAIVATSLGELGDARAISALDKCVSDEDKSVRENAVKALEKIRASQTLGNVTKEEYKSQNYPVSIKMLKVTNSAKSSGVLETPILPQVYPKLTQTIEDLLIETEEFILSLGNDVQFKQNKDYVAFKREPKNTNIASILLSTKHISIIVKHNPDEIILEEGFTKVADVSFWGKDRFGIRLQSKADLEKAKPLIAKSYELNG